MFANWLQGVRSNPQTELERVIEAAPDRVVRLVSEELDVSQAVILLMALPSHISEQIFRNLSDERAESFTRQAAQLGPLDAHTRQLALTDVVRRLRQA